MAVTVTPAVQISEGNWLFEWTSDQTGVTFKVYHEGRLVQMDPRQSIIIASDVEPQVEVDDGTMTIQQQAYPSRVTLQWYGVSGAFDYLVQEYIAAAWETLEIMPHDGIQYHQWQSEHLDDVSSHLYRVVPRDSAGREGTAVALSSIKVYRNPDTPTVDFAYDSGSGDVTISAE